MHGSSTFGPRAARRRSERELAAERLHAMANPGRPGWVPDDPSEDGEVADRGGRRPASAARGGGVEEKPVDDLPREPAPLVGDTLRARLLDRLPGTVRAARWSVPPGAVFALLALAGVLALVVAVRMASATPGTPVPVRSSDGVPVGTSAQPPPGRGAGSGGRDVGETAAAAGGAGSTPQPASGPPPSTASSAEVVVHVVGQVASPGLVRVPAGARVDDALRAAGGATGEADLARVNLARQVVDGEQLFVPRPGEEGPVPGGSASGSGSAPAGAAPPGGGPPTAPPGRVVNLNAATLEQLDGLPGIGPVLAQRILDWRVQNGRFTSVDELGEVSGIGPRLLERLRPLVTA